MKIRNGFVSNSSSSSFVIVCSKEAFDKYTIKAHPFYLAWIKQHLYPETQKFMGKDIIVISKHVSSEDGSEVSGWDLTNLPKGIENYGDENNASFDGREIMDSISEALQKCSKDVIVTQESC